MAHATVDDVLGALRDVGFSSAHEGGKPGLSQYLREVPKPPIEEELDR
ncbi:hypothetical protein AB0I98_07260 [Streptomyces sp. NPDC050211]